MAIIIGASCGILGYVTYTVLAPLSVVAAIGCAIMVGLVLPTSLINNMWR